MKDVVLIIGTFAIFVFGYFVMKKVDDFIEENSRLIAAGNRTNSCPVRIAAENPMFFNSAAPALEHCSNANPYIEFFFSSGSIKRLLQRLSNGAIDIALLSEENTKDLCKDFVFVRIPYQTEQRAVTMLGLQVDNIDEARWICVAWNKTIPSKVRDRVIFALENEYCR